jgi:hypothetical protein
MSAASLLAEVWPQLRDVRKRIPLKWGDAFLLNPRARQRAVAGHALAPVSRAFPSPRIPDSPTAFLDSAKG